MERDLRAAVGRNLAEREKFILWAAATNSIATSRVNENEERQKLVGSAQLQRLAKTVLRHVWSPHEKTAK